METNYKTTSNIEILTRKFEDYLVNIEYELKYFQYYQNKANMLVYSLNSCIIIYARDILRLYMFCLVDEQNLGNLGTWTNVVSFLELKKFNEFGSLK